MTCSTCKHFRKFGSEPKGECYLNPPVPLANGCIMRAKVDSDGPRSGCGQHSTGEPIVLGKVQVETHGAVVKSAQQTKKEKLK